MNDFYKVTFSAQSLSTFSTFEDALKDNVDLISLILFVYVPPCLEIVLLQNLFHLL